MCDNSTNCDETRWRCSWSAVIASTTEAKTHERQSCLEDDRQHQQLSPTAHMGFSCRWSNVSSLSSPLWTSEQQRVGRGTANERGSELVPVWCHTHGRLRSDRAASCSLRMWASDDPTVAQTALCPLESAVPNVVAQCATTKKGNIGCKMMTVRG